uniref:Putative chemosensory protein 10 n=1 Tax=Ectropis obliqua TaxID=248899 RepID=A0A1W5LBV8_ECTOB|nr:putative chemosensory protein 10 [Ectropis obliqua]
MKSFCIVALALVAACNAAYTSDAGLDVDTIVKDKEAVQKVLKCFNGGDCSSQAAALKTDFPHALGSACAECTPEQKHNVKLFMGAVEKFFPEEYKSLKTNFDPENKLFPALLAAVAAH